LPRVSQKEEKLFLSLEKSKEREMELESELEATKTLITELEVCVIFSLSRVSSNFMSLNHREPSKPPAPAKIWRSRTCRASLRFDLLSFFLILLLFVRVLLNNSIPPAEFERRS